MPNQSTFRHFNTPEVQWSMYSASRTVLPASQRTLSLGGLSLEVGAEHQEVHLGVEEQALGAGAHPIASVRFSVLCL